MNRHIAVLSTTFFVGMTSPLVAKGTNHDLSCHFSLECIAGEVCEQTDFDMDINLTEAADSALITIVTGSLSIVAETLDVTGFYNDSRYSVNGGGMFPATHMVTVGAEGNAVYTNHINSEMSITYTGACS